MLGYNLNNILSFILPHYCHLCDNLLDSKMYHICHLCQNNLKQMMHFIELPRKGLNGACSQFFSFIDYHQIKDSLNLVAEIKTSNKSFLLDEILKNLKDLEKLPKPDEIVYIPASYRKILERGFNPSFIIAKYFSSYFGVPIKKVLIKKDTLSQSLKNRKQRLYSMTKSIFNIKNVPKNKNTVKIVMIIDDIITTGATLSNAANMIKQSYHAQTQAIGVSLFHSEGL